MKETLENQIARLGKKSVIEITKMPDSLFICSIWSLGQLVSSGVGTEVHEAVKRAEEAIEEWIDERTKGRYYYDEEDRRTKYEE